MGLITSLENSLIKSTAKLVNQKKFRDEKNEFVIEGEKSVLEWVSLGYPIRNLFYLEEFLGSSENADLILENSQQSDQVSEEILSKISGTKSPQNITAVARKLEQKSRETLLESSQNIIVLENIMDPGNLGTLIRTADAMGIGAVFLLGETADIYSPKVVRSTAASLFRLPIIRIDESVFESFKKHGFKTYASFLSDKSVLLSQTKFASKNAVFIGNEGSGLSKETVNSCDIKIIIDMAGSTESLNAAVAGSILMWEISKKR